MICRIYTLRKHLIVVIGLFILVVVSYFKMIDIPHNETGIHNEILNHLFSNTTDTQVEDLYDIVEFAKKHEIFHYDPRIERKNKDEVK